MRRNIPITNIEHEISDADTIVSTTDLQGNITYTNPYFVEVSGFVLSELIGAPQNFVRHPDMPAEAIDMRIRFNLGTPTCDEFTIAMVLNIGGAVMGTVVDSMSDVTTLAPWQIRPAPQLGSAIGADYLIGLGTIDERMLILIDIDKLMVSDDIGLARKLAG